MKIKKQLLVVGAVSALSVAGVTGAVVSAAGTGGADSLVAKIAQKFNLKQADVQAVFDADRASHEAERQAQAEKELTQAVTDGKITSAQKDLILAKQKEVKADMEANRDAMKDKTEAERHSAMDAKRTALEQWAKDNGIPTDFLRYVFGGGRGPGGPDGAPRS